MHGSLSETHPSFVLAAVVALSRRVSVTLVEAVVIPRLLFVINAYIKKCLPSSGKSSGSGGGGSDHLSSSSSALTAESLDVVHALPPRAQAHLRDVLHALADLVTCVSASYVKLRVLGPAAAPSLPKLAQSPILTLFAAAAAQLHQQMEESSPPYVCAGIANAWARLMQNCNKAIANDTTFKPLLLPTVVAVLKGCAAVILFPLFAADHQLIVFCVVWVLLHA